MTDSSIFKGTGYTSLDKQVRRKTLQTNEDSTGRVYK
jgi:hypothetical protein